MRQARQLGLEEGCSFPVGDKLAETPAGDGVIARQITEVGGEVLESRPRVRRILSNYIQVIHSPPTPREPLPKHLQKMSFFGLPADYEDFCDGWQQFFEVGPMVRRPFKRVFGLRLHWNSDRRNYGPPEAMDCEGVAGVGDDVLVGEIYAVGVFDELVDAKSRAWRWASKWLSRGKGL